jgi:hypothetical protein
MRIVDTIETQFDSLFLLCEINILHESNEGYECVDMERERERAHCQSTAASSCIVVATFL